MTTTKTELKLFLEDLSIFLPVSTTRNKEDVIDKYSDFILEDCCKKDYKFSKIKKWILDNYKKSNFPEVAFIKEAMQYGEIKNYEVCKDEGKLIVVTLPNGRRYEFTVCGFASHDLNYYEKNIKKKFGQATVEIYPKEAQFVGDELFWNIEIPNAENIDSAELAELERAKQQELEKQVIKYEIK